MKHSRFLFFCATAILVSGMSSCDKTTGNDNTGEESYTLELADPVDKEIILNDDDSETFKIGIKTELAKEELRVYEKDGKTWCDATIDSADSIKVTPGSNFTEEDITATFVICGIEGIDVTPVEFTVIRRGTSTEYFVKIESAQITSGGYEGIYMYNPAAKSADDLVVTVETNAARWYLNDNNMVFDDEFNPIGWYSIDKMSGRNGETVTIKFSDNTSGDDRMSSISFQYDVNGYDGPSITVTQTASPATFLNILIDGNKIEGKSYDVVLDVNKSDFSFDMEKDGSVTYKFVKPGTNEVDSTAEDWITVSNYYGWSISHWTEESKSVDLVFTPAGDSTELFRFKITVN